MTANSIQDTETELFNCKYSFMGVPFSTNVSQSKAAIIGIPFDCGTHPTRIGSRQGPQSIREQSALVRPYQPPLADFNPLTRLNVVDCGDVDVTPGVIEESFDRIEAAITRVAAAGTIPVTMGGDGAVTLPQLRALHKIHPDLVVLHIDAHTDTYPGAGNHTHDLTTSPRHSPVRLKKAWSTRRIQCTSVPAARLRVRVCSSTPVNMDMV